MRNNPAVSVIFLAQAGHNKPCFLKRRFADQHHNTMQPITNPMTAKPCMILIAGNALVLLTSANEAE
jgi:hypothetical protein